MNIEIVVWHVGGGGEDFGPIERILKLEGVTFKVFLFELRDSTESKMESIPKISTNPNIKLNLIPIGLANTNEERDFFINDFELSSSLLSPSSLTSNDNPGFSRWGAEYKKMLHWHENTKLKEVKKVKTSFVDELVRNSDVPAPEVLSMDIQGTEVEVLEGAKVAFKKTILAVTTESEFFEIYKGQGLFHEQLKILERESFRFVKFFGFQKWFPGPMIGHGFTTVTESLFVKYLVDSDQLRNTNLKFHEFENYTSLQIFKIALISYSYERFSYFYSCVEYIDKNDQAFMESFKQSSNLINYYEKYLFIKKNIAKLNQDPHFFIRNPNSNYRSLAWKFKNIFYNFTDSIVSIFHLRGLIFKTDRHFNRFGEMD